jgi:ABC-type sugar transport system permease subunit
MEVFRKGKKVNKLRVLFILTFITVPVLQWLLFYVYTNFSAILMAFRDSANQWSLENFARFFKEFELPTSQIRIAFKNTFLTFGILFVTFPFKVLVSYFIYKKVPFSGFYRVVFFLPTIIFSVAWALIFTQIIGVDGAIAKAVQEWMGLDYTPELLADSKFANTVVLLNMMWLSFPGDLIIWGGTFARIPDDVLESAKIDGVTWWTEFTKIIVPMVWPTVALQMVLLFCGIFGASGNVFLLTRGNYGTMTLTAWMYMSVYNGSGGNYTSGVYNYMSAVGLLLTTVAIIISLSIRKMTDKVFDEVEY